jgi:peptidoglycan/LPS O-acetylase OafA/YrhL
MSSAGFVERIDAFKAMVPSLSAPLKTGSGKRILEIDILRTAAILLLVLFNLPGTIAAYSPVSANFFLLINGPLHLVGFIGASIFMFVSGLSLQLSNKTIRNRGSVLYFFKKRMVRIYPLYWVFVAGILISYKPPPVESAIYIVGLQSLFYPVFMSVDIYHFVSALLIFYLLFPLLAYSNDIKKLLLVALIPFLFFAVIQLQWGISDPLLLQYYGIFVAGIVAGKADVVNKIRQVNSKQFFVFTIPAFGVLSLIWLSPAGSYVPTSIISGAVLGYVLGALFVFITLYWAAFYVRVSHAKFITFFTFVAFSTYGVYLIFIDFFLRVSQMLQSSFHIEWAVVTAICIALIPFVVVVGYLLQLITNAVMSSLMKQKH